MSNVVFATCRMHGRYRFLVTVQSTRQCPRALKKVRKAPETRFADIKRAHMPYARVQSMGCRDPSARPPSRGEDDNYHIRKVFAEGIYVLGDDAAGH